MKINTSAWGILIGLIFAFVPFVQAADTHPNIIVILADDFGWGDTTAYRPDSKVPTPAIDRIAREGIRCTNAHAPSSVCTPSRYGLLTGRYPWRTWLKQQVAASYAPAMLRPGQATLPSVLKKQGYHTAGFGKWHIGMDWELPHEHDSPKDRENRALKKGPETTRKFSQAIDHSKPINHQREPLRTILTSVNCTISRRPV